MSVVQVNSVTEFNESLEGNELVVVDFAAPWCRNCKKILPFLQTISEELSTVKFIKVDVSELEQLAVDQGVSTLPFLAFFKNKEKVDSYFGSKWDKIEERIRAHAARGSAASANPATEAHAEGGIVSDTTGVEVEQPAKKKARVAAGQKPLEPPAPRSNVDTRICSALNVAMFPGGLEAVSPVSMQPDAADIAQQLQKSVLAMYAEFMADDGSWVDYTGLGRSAAFAQYVQLTAQLQHADISALSPSQRKAFCLNLYNALCIHGNVVCGAPSPAVSGSITSFFENVRYRIGVSSGGGEGETPIVGTDFSLDDLEHGLLRANAVHPSTQKARFSEDDPRRALALPLDPRIHCALVCGAKSCPPIRVYTEDVLERGLDLATTAFCDSETEVDEAGKKVSLSKIFLWYARDFGADDTAVLRWICERLTPGTSTQVALAAMLESNSAIALEYKNYDWGSNSVWFARKGLF